MQSAPIQVAQIGVGYWGPNLLRNLATSEHFQLRKVADADPTRRRFVTDKFPNVEAVSTLEDLTGDPALEAIVIATPAHSHFEIASACLSAGKHVLVEKPLATSVREVRRLAGLASSRDLVCMVGHTFLYSTPVRYLKRLIDSGELGQVRYVYSQRLNLGRIRSDVDALWNLAPHDVSIIQFLLGDPMPLRVTRHGMDYVQRGIEDVVFLHMVYPNKVIANVHVSWLDPLKTRRMVVVGTDRMAVYDDVSEQKITIYDKGIDRWAILGEDMDYDHPQRLGFSHRSGEIRVPSLDEVEPLQTEVSHFAGCIRGETCLTGPEHAARVVHILETAIQTTP